MGMVEARRRAMGVVARAEHGALQLRAAGGGGFINLAPTGGFLPWGGPGGRQNNTEKYSLYRGWLYSAIHALASEAAGQPVALGRLAGAAPAGSQPGTRMATKGATALALRRAPGRVKAASEELEVVASHPMLDLLENPNPIQHRWQFVYSFISMLNLTGWAYVVGGPTEDGKGHELYALPTDWVQPNHEQGPFSRFRIVDPMRPTEQASADEWLTRENVAFAHIPNPADPRTALAPAGSQLAAAKIDDHIQTSQGMFFENGIFPSVLVQIGRDPHPDVPGGMRPRLTATQRRQVMAAIRKSMSGVANYGNPAIIDGMIESIERLSSNSTEMGWERSEQTVRTRILSAFGVHPYILGEPVSVGGYAQAAKIEERFCKRVNTYLDMLGTVATHFCQQLVGKKSDRLVVWWEECKPHDPSLHWQNLNAARQRGDITRNEIRAELGLPPDETGGDHTRNFAAGDLNAIVQIQAAVAGGGMLPEQAAVLYEIALDLAPEDAKKLAGPKPPPKPEVGPDGQPLPGQGGGQPGQGAGTPEAAVRALEAVALGLRPSSQVRINRRAARRAQQLLATASGA